MECARSGGFDFSLTLVELFAATGRIEASFASKLHATLHPNAPVTDSVVLENLGLRLPAVAVPDRLATCSNESASIITKPVI